MNEHAKAKVDLFGVCCGIAYLFAVFGGWGLAAGFLPATPPAFDAAQIQALFQSDYTRIRIGMLILMFAALIFIPFAATMARQLARIEGGVGTLSLIFVLGAVGNMVLTFYPAVWWLTAAFRPERAAELIQLMNDMAWLQFLGGISMYLAMPLAVTAASLLDSSADPIFPRWCGYANAWLAVLILPDQLLFFFHEGPFAWNGLFGLWIPVVVFSGFFLVNCYVLHQRLRRELRTPLAAPSRGERLQRA